MVIDGRARQFRERDQPPEAIRRDVPATVPEALAGPPEPTHQHFDLDHHDRIDPAAVPPCHLQPGRNGSPFNVTPPTTGTVRGPPLQPPEATIKQRIIHRKCEVAGGEGVYGLQRAFHMAGAQTTVADSRPQAHRENEKRPTIRTSTELRSAC
jgi:hypothetical protein